MPNRVRIVTVAYADRVNLERMARDRGGPGRVAERARIVLLSAQGLTGPQIAERVGCSEPTVVKWRAQYAQAGAGGGGRAPPPPGAENGVAPGGGAGGFFPAGGPPPPGPAGPGGPPPASPPAAGRGG